MKSSTKTYTSTRNVVSLKLRKWNIIILNGRSDIQLMEMNDPPPRYSDNVELDVIQKNLKSGGIQQISTGQRNPHKLNGMRTTLDKIFRYCMVFLITFLFILCSVIFILMIKELNTREELKTDTRKLHKTSLFSSPKIKPVNRE